ncbi:hypothetical protein JQK62_23940, partial [Leptospira santarosai]|nr:hypothetical protein [Leptospira santarosai]
FHPMRNISKHLISDAILYGGSGQLNSTPMHANKIPHHNLPCSMEITVPPLGIAIFMKETKTRQRGVNTDGI